MIKLKWVTAVLIILLQSFSLLAQPLPTEIKNALSKATRTVEGVPGKNYWQNSSSYTIQAKLLAEKSILKGKEDVTYYNNSPDTLKKIVVRLYPDLYKKGNSRSWNLGADDITDGTKIENLKIDGLPIDLKDSKQVRFSSTNLHIYLPNTLNPGDSLVLHMDWQFFIPKKRWVRMGNYGKGKFFIAYWYPQIAVYDDIDGWDEIEYTGMVEFYNDFNNFNVSIDLPAGFAVWATGELQDADTHFHTDVLKRIEEAKQSDEVVAVIAAADREANKVFKKRASETWTFVANKVPDFSFGVSKNANWDACSVIVDSSSGRRVLVNAVYPDSVVTFDKAALWSRESISYMSHDLPGIPFPYPHMTSFCNGRHSGGMESPMMANNGDPLTESSALGLIFHEILHTYFPFYMGTNERKYAWMDEGWAAYLTAGIINRLAPEDSYLSRYNKSFEAISGKEKEARLMDLSYQITDYQSYRNHAYNKSAMGYYVLHDALGDELFKEALKVYLQRWQGKHPIPIDFFNTFSSVSGEDLGWFFKPWFYGKKKADLGIKKVTQDSKVVVENIGGLPLPIQLKCTYEDGSTEMQYQNASQWRNGKQSVVFQLDADKKIKDIQIGSEIIPDINKANNSWYFEL